MVLKKLSRLNEWLEHSQLLHRIERILIELANICLVARDKASVVSTLSLFFLDFRALNGFWHLTWRQGQTTLQRCQLILDTCTPF